jgi:hypothetical protein
LSLAAAAVVVVVVEEEEIPQPLSEVVEGGRPFLLRLFDIYPLSECW